MTIGELLKEYRISQTKKQKDFTNNGIIISQSYYSKVEKNEHRLSAESLIELLHYNNIPLKEFFSRLNQSDDMLYQQVSNFNKIITEAFYDNDKERIKGIIPLIKESNLSPQDKQDELLFISAWLELMKKSDEKPDFELRNKIKERIFNIPNFNYTKVKLFCNFMKFYDLDTNKMISRKIIEQHINTKSIKMQAVLLAIIINILAFSLKNGQENTVTYFIKSGEKIKVRPELVFYKSAFYFFENLINYCLTGNQIKYENSVKTKDFLVNIGMKKYASILDGLLRKYK